MKAVKIIFNILGILLAIVLSLALVLVLTVSPVVTAASDIVKPETIHKYITKIDYEKVLVDSGVDLEGSMGDYGIPAGAITEIMKTDAIGDVVELYVKDIEAAINGEDVTHLTPDAIKQIAGENIDSLVDIALDLIPESEIPEEISKEEAKETIKTTLTGYIDENAEEIVSYLPDVKEIIVETVDTEVIETVRYVQNGTFTTGLWLAIAVLSLLIFGCRWPRFKGFMWLGVVYFIGTVATSILGFMLNGVLLDLILANLPLAGEIVSPAVSVVGESVTKTAIILGVLTVLFIAIFIVGRVLLAKNKKKKLAFAAAGTAPVAEQTVAAEIDAPEETVLTEVAVEEIAVNTEETVENTTEE